MTNKKPAFTKRAEEATREAWLASLPTAQLAFDPDNEYRDNVIVAQQAHVRLLYSAHGRRFEVDSDHGDYRHFIVAIEAREDFVYLVLCSGPQQDKEELSMSPSAENLVREQFWVAHEMYRMVLDANGLADNSAFAKFR